LRSSLVLCKSRSCHFRHHLLNDRADESLISWFLPIGFIQAITNVQLGLNVFTEFLIGYMQPGKPNAMMLFKTYGYITMTQGLAFTQDMKLGKLTRRSELFVCLQAYMLIEIPRPLPQGTTQDYVPWSASRDHLVL
jgi:hypothetical protein